VTEPALWLALGLTVVSLFAGTANLALREMSRLRLHEILETRRKTELADKLIGLQPELILSTATLRMMANVGIILAMVELFHLSRDPLGARWLHYLEALVGSLVLILIFSVAVPNAWSKYAGEEFLVRTSPVLQFFRWILRPVTSFLHLFDGLVRRLAGVPKEEAGGGENNGREVLEREILEAVSGGEMQGTMDEDEKEMIESVIELRDTHAGQIMTPRTEMITLQADATLEAVKQLIAREGHSRIPVCDGSLDDIVGVLYAKDLLQLEAGAPFDVRQVMRRVPFVPEGKRLRELLHQFQANKVHLAIVLDEYGGTAGLVTFEDILEELVGEIADEYEPPEPEPLVRLGPDLLEVDGRVRVDQINDELAADIPEDEDYDTVGGFVFSTLGRIPKSGEEFTYKQLRIKILEAGPRKVNRVSLERLSQDQPS